MTRTFWTLWLIKPDLPPKNQWTEHHVEYPVVEFIDAANVNRFLNSTVGLERIHQVTNTIRIANIGWRIRIYVFANTLFFSEAINFIRQFSKFHTVIMLSNFINLIKTIIEMNEFYNFLSTSALKIYFLNINT